MTSPFRTGWHEAARAAQGCYRRVQHTVGTSGVQLRRESDSRIGWVEGWELVVRLGRRLVTGRLGEVRRGRLRGERLRMGRLARVGLSRERLGHRRLRGERLRGRPAVALLDHGLV